MASSSGGSSGSGNGGRRSSGSEEDQEAERKRRRMQSNRESARRSRLRKQKHLDDLTAQITRLMNHKNQIVANMNAAANLCVSLETENSILRAQMTELTHRLQYLNDMVTFVESMTAGGDFSNNGFDEEDYYPWDSPFANEY